MLKGKPFAAAVCCRRYWRYWRHNLKTVRRLGTAHGGAYADGIHFRYQGGQICSLLSYLGSGEDRKRYFGVKIPPTNVQDYHLEAARKFAGGLANRLLDGARESQ